MVGELFVRDQMRTRITLYALSPMLSDAVSHLRLCDNGLGQLSSVIIRTHDVAL